MADATPNVDVTTKPPRRFYRLRIAVSMFIGVVTVLLCMLWIRSYWWMDMYQRVGPNRDTLTITSLNGEVVASSRTWSNVFKIYTRYNSGPITDDVTKFWNDSQGISRVHLHTQYWKLLLITATCSVVVWMRFRFSLHTLLIATTLVAVVLGLAVWAGR